ncbi:EamA family transporter [Sciscionella marina]|uniref:EamA family transporter n=1 Tax=Sciscionella marina TaxID=508770 RepID=UPI000366253C
MIVVNSLAMTFVLLAAVAHAGWNFAAKGIGGSGSAIVWLYSMVSTVVCLPFAIVFACTEQHGPQWSWLLAALVSAAAHVGYGIVLQRGYAVGDLSVVYPLARGTGPLLSVLFAVLLFGERPGVLGLIGAAAVVLGVLVISSGGSRAAGSRALSIGYGVATGATIAVYTLWDDHSMTGIGVPPIVYFGLTVLGESVMLAPIAARDFGVVAGIWRKNWRRVVIIGVLSPVAYLLVLYAMRIAPVSLVAPARESSIVLGALAGWLLLREPNPVRRLIGSAIALAGIVALGLS